MMQGSSSDARLVERALGGQQDAFETLVRRYLGAIWAVAYARVGNGADAEDIAQATFTKVYQSLDTLRDGRRFAQWTARIARNESLSLLRKRQRETPLTGVELANRVEPPVNFAARELERELRQEILSLPEQGREVLLLYYFAGKSTPEISIFLGISKAAAKKRLERARHDLGQRLVERLGLAPEDELPSEHRIGKIMGAVAGGQASSATTASREPAHYGMTRELAGSSTGAAVFIGTITMVLAAFSISAVLSHRFQVPMSNTSEQIAQTQEVVDDTVQVADDQGETAAVPSSNANGRLTSSPAADSQPATKVPELDHLPSGVIKGKVIDTLNRPLPGADITLFRVDGYGRLLDAARPLQTTVANEEGKFRFEGLDPGLSNTNIPQYRGAYFLVAATGGQVGTMASVLTQNKLHDYVVLAMENAGRWKGTVVTETGAPVANALVLPFEHKDVDADSDRKWWMSSTFCWRLGAATDDKGQFMIDQLEDGVWRFLVVAKDLAALETGFTSPGGNLKFTLNSGATVTGRLTNGATGAPVADTEVTLVSEKIFQDRRTARTDVNGNYEIRGIGGAYRIALNHPELVTTTDLVVAPEPEQRILKQDIEAISGAVVTGCIFDKNTGQGISSVVVSAAMPRYPLRISEATGADGRFRIEGLPAGHYWVGYSGARGYAHSDRWRKRVERNFERSGVVDDVDFTLARGLSIQGRVVDIDGQPVASAKVQSHKSSVHDRPITYTDHTGRFELWGFTTADKPRLRVSSETHASDEIGPLSIPPGGLEGLVITAHPAATVEGILVDGLGQPIVDAGVNARPIDGEMFAMPSMHTARDGSFVLGGLSQGAYTTDVLPPGTNVYINEPFARFRVLPGQVIPNLRVVYDDSVGFKIAGRVIDISGEPVTNASVSVSGPSHTFGRVDGEGRFTFSRLAEGEYVVTASEPNYTSTRLARIPAGTQDLDIVLEGAGRIEGRVVDAETGQAIETFEVMHMPHRGGFLGGWTHRRFEEVNESNGRFVLESVAKGDATVVARAPGYAMTSHYIEQVGPDLPVSDVEVKLERGKIVRGKVVAPDGKGVRDALVFIGGVPGTYGMYWNEMADTRTDGDGRFYLDTVSSTTRYMTGFHPDYAPTPVAVSFDDPMTIRLQQKSGIEGFVTVQGAPLTGADLHITSGRDFSRGVSTNAEGWYESKDLFAGDVRVRADLELDELGAEKRMVYKNARIEEGWVTRLDFDYGSTGATLEGTLTYNGAPLPSVGVGVYIDLPNGEKVIHQTPADASGRYRIPDLPAGHTTIKVLRWKEDETYVGWWSCPTDIAFTLQNGETRQQDLAATGESAHARTEAFWSYWQARRPD